MYIPKMNLMKYRHEMLDFMRRFSFWQAKTESEQVGLRKKEYYRRAIKVRRYYRSVNRRVYAKEVAS
jgi:hypothetical protein